MEPRSQTVAEKSVESAARNLVALIRQNLSADSHPPPSAAAALNTPSVSSEMQRSFPGIFRGKRRFLNRPQTVTRKRLCFQVYLLPSPATVTPKADEELRFFQAGLGMRMVSLPEDAAHDQISEMLNQEYPKLQTLKGSWMFYKASGGHGQRQLTIVSPQVEGYTTSQLKRASNGGKYMLYIAPLQGELDVTPLSKNASEFSKMPKATCENCQETMPIHLLALHVESCKENVTDCNDQDQDYNSDTECVSVSNSSTDDTVLYPRSTSRNDINTNPTAVSSMTSCPICRQLYPTHTVEIHASFCGESIPDVQDNAGTSLPQSTAPSTSAGTSGEIISPFVQ
ncbi:uncharacterized protein LOC127530390 [Acanthochromis polyacanthus]|uniref:uncharacterized protein LOC127530390 n=1 Tax=Acanthochromis polyacanthus TaxID=80966 RepID=UPI002234C788|nr:uncharacterized protein LOC127530390 [Acanthochromis polyacanthus]